MDGDSQAEEKEVQRKRSRSINYDGVHLVLNLDESNVLGIAENIAGWLTIPEILRFRRVNAVFAAGVKVKRIAMQYSWEVQGIIQQTSIFNLPDAIFLPIITVYNGDDPRALETLLGLQPCMMVVVTSPSPRVLIDNLWFQPPMLGICPNLRRRYTHMAQVLTEVGERPLVLKCVVSSLLFWCDTCNKWDDNEDGHPDFGYCHKSRRWQVAKSRRILACGGWKLLVSM